jgi:hypothetical protein
MREGARHEIYGRDDLDEPIPVPRHTEITPFVIKSIARALGVPLREFIQAIRNC